MSELGGRAVCLVFEFIEDEIALTLNLTLDPRSVNSFLVKAPQLLHFVRSKQLIQRPGQHHSTSILRAQQIEKSAGMSPSTTYPVATMTACRNVPTDL